MSQQDLDELLSERKITKRQHLTAIRQVGVNVRVTTDGDLWISNNQNQRILVDRKGNVVFDGKRLTTS